MTSYFEHPEWEQFAPGRKTLDDALLAQFAPELSESALQQLQALGVEVQTGLRVEPIRAGELVANGETFRADNIIWGAGVAGAPIAKQLGVELDRGGGRNCCRT